jgi:hypothetical protein
MPHSSKRISSSLSEIISKISWTIFNFCRLDISTRTTRRSLFRCDRRVLTYARRCFRQSEDPLIIVAGNKIIQVQGYQRIILNNPISTEMFRFFFLSPRRRRIVRWRVSVSRRWAEELEGEIVSGHNERKVSSLGSRCEAEFALRHAHLSPRDLIRLLARPPPETRTQ